MKPIIVMLCSAAFCIVLFLVFDFLSTEYYLKKHQKEWDELKSAIIEINPNIPHCDLIGVYIDFCKEKGSYFPSF